MRIESLISRGFKFNKALGQNFITDTNLLKAIAIDADVNASDTVIEIGAGAGTLTAQLACAAKRVIAFEIDTNLESFLKENLSALDNVELHFKDILKIPFGDFLAIIKNKWDGKPFKVVANLPYYITTPIIFYFLENNLCIDSITIMVQNEVAKRIVAKPSTPDYGALSLAVAARCDAKITRFVSRAMFTPQPNVDSAVVNLKILHPFDAYLSRVIKVLFAMRRKTAVNNLSAGFSLPKTVCEEVIAKAGHKPTARGEEFNISQVKTLAGVLKEYL